MKKELKDRKEKERRRDNHQLARVQLQKTEAWSRKGDVYVWVYDVWRLEGKCRAPVDDEDWLAGD